MRPSEEQEHEQAGLLNGGQQDDGINLYLALAVCCSCVGGLMFGYDSAVVSGLLVMIKQDLGQALTSTEKELVTAITSIGALIGSIITGIYADKVGRKYVIAVSCYTFIASSLLMALSLTVSILVLGRFIAGLAIGAASTSVPVYVAEVSPSKHRGKLVALNSVSTTGGQVIALLAGWQLRDVPAGWRIMLGIGAFPPLCFLLTAGAIPESPRFLIKTGRIPAAESALRRLHPGASPQDIQYMINEQALDSKDEDFGFKRLFQTRYNINALIVACSLMAAQQLCGFNAFMYYSSTVFEMAGFKDPIFVSMTAVSGTNFLFTWVAVVYVDRIGRRKMLLGTIWIMIIALIVTANSFSGKAVSNGTTMITTTVLYVASYAMGLGNIPWQATEFMSLDVRALGSMMVSSTNWIFNSMVSMTFLSALDTIRPKGIYSLYTAFTVAAYVGIYFCYPEVSGMSLEDISEVFDRPIMYLGRVNSLV